MGAIDSGQPWDGDNAVDTRPVRRDAGDYPIERGTRSMAAGVGRWAGPGTRRNAST